MVKQRQNVSLRDLKIYCIVLKVLIFNEIRNGLKFRIFPSKDELDWFQAILRVKKWDFNRVLMPFRHASEHARFRLL